MKSALLRGLSVKEWELTCLFPHGLPEDVNPLADRLGGDELLFASHADAVEESLWSPSSLTFDSSIGVESVDLITCDSLNADRLVTSHSDRGRRAVSGLRSVGPSLTINCRNFLDEYVEQFVLLETFFRSSIAETADREWLSILQREVPARRMLRAAEQNFWKNTFLFQRLPVSIRLISKGSLWLALMVMSVYFLIATVFGTLFCCCVMNTLFFSIFIAPYNVFPYGCALIVTACQCVLFCSRGVELMRRTYEGQLIDAFRVIGPKGLLLQGVVCIAAVVVFFVVFCVVASNHGVVTGIQYSTGSGWIVALCIILLYHFLYAFGMTGYRRSMRQGDASVATLYFFLDVDMDADHVTAHDTPTAEVAIASVVALSAFAFGFCYLLHGAIFFLGAAVIMTSLVALLTVLFVNAGHNLSTGCLIIVAALYSCLTWLTIIFTSTAHGWRGNWGCSMAALLAVVLVTDTVIAVCAFMPVQNRVARRWIFRAAWVWIVIQSAVFLIFTFFTDYRMGIITLAFGLHLVLYGLRASYGSSNYGAVLTIVFFVAMLLFCVVGGWRTARVRYDTPASPWLLPDYSKNSTVDLAFPAYDNWFSSSLPVCWPRFSAHVDIVGMALFAKLSNARSLDVRLTDLHAWFPNFTYIHNSSFSSLSFLRTEVFETSSNGYTTTILALSPSDHIYPLIESMTMWVNVVAFSLLSPVTPPLWFIQLVSYVTATEKLSPLLWKASIAQAREELGHYVASVVSPTHDVFLVGHGLAGAAAAFFVFDMPEEVHGVTFASPLNAIAWRSGRQWMSDALPGRVLSIVSSSAVFALGWMWGELSEVIPCTSFAGECHNIDSIARLLWAICRQNGTLPSD
ncbi:hypothetical protein TRSC58_02633 [Trypanosoma rangeli SC58]|uniref:Uncharacterized protein n=1 Tax=Trypanosoma rangeli SC58 TaxID=429131 RepID=A0A061J452_TRYRA|nr:hypothetical protein TRSC58_02633 [Trypanosoma rangeli SC58]